MLTSPTPAYTQRSDVGDTFAQPTTLLPFSATNAQSLIDLPTHDSKESGASVANVAFPVAIPSSYMFLSKIEFQFIPEWCRILLIRTFIPRVEVCQDMTISEQQLETWSNQGAITSSKNTHERIRDVINGSQVLSGKSYEIYLQGSYKNTTNIRGDSDVDIVVQLNSTFYHNSNQLSEHERQQFHAQHTDATYSWHEFKADLTSVLRDAFGSDAVKIGNKSIKIDGGNGRLPADVVPSALYRHYDRYTGIGKNGDYVEGMCFWSTKENRQVINYPKEHYNNGVSKNQNTGEMYKPIIRIFKNARTYMDAHGLFDKSLAPGYFIEGLLYNVPNDKFKQQTYQSAFIEVINWLYSVDIDKFVCQNEQVYLFGNTTEQWKMEDAAAFTTALIKLWHDWSR